jgi:hypothetical protein
VPKSSRVDYSFSSAHQNYNLFAILLPNFFGKPISSINFASNNQRELSQKKGSQDFYQGNKDLNLKVKFTFNQGEIKGNNVVDLMSAQNDTEWMCNRFENGGDEMKNLEVNSL